MTSYPAHRNETIMKEGERMKWKLEREEEEVKQRKGTKKLIMDTG